MNRYFIIGQTEQDEHNKMCWWDAEDFGQAETQCLASYPSMKILSITNGGIRDWEGKKPFNPFQVEPMKLPSCIHGLVPHCDICDKK